MAPKLLTAGEAGHILGVSAARMRQLSDRGVIRVIRCLGLGGLRLFNEGDVRSLARKRELRSKAFANAARI